MTARAALARAAARVLARPEATCAGLLAGAAASLAAALGRVGLDRLLASDRPFAGLFVLSLGLGLGAVLAAGGLATALSAPRARPIAAPRPVVALIALRAIGGSLLGGLAIAAAAPALVVVGIAGEGQRGTAALGAALAAGPPLLVALFAVPTFAVAIARAASGATLPEALDGAITTAVLRFPSLLRVGLAAGVATAPLWLLALGLGAWQASTESRPAFVLAAAARGAALLLAGAWAWTAVAETIGEAPGAPPSTTSTTAPARG